MKLRFVAPLAAALLIACGGGTKTSAKSGGLDASGRPLPVGSDDQGKGVSLTGEHAYDDRHDSSGWSGQTALPGAIGGGPMPSASAPPAASSAPPAPAASALPPSKELDTSPPSKELQF